MSRLIKVLEIPYNREQLWEEQLLSLKKKDHREKHDNVMDLLEGWHVEKRLDLFVSSGRTRTNNKERHTFVPVGTSKMEILLIVRTI